MAMKKDAVLISDVWKSFGKKSVLCGLSMRVPSGSIYAFLGRNGEGKTTTMRLLMDMLQPDRGATEILGQKSRNNPLLRRRIGYVPEQPFFYPWMRVEEILSFVRQSMKERWDAGRAAELIRRLDLPLASPFGSLSTGIKAKVSLTAALAHNPEILLLDDPISGLDAVVRREFLETLVEIAHDGACTIVFSSHIISEIERVADEVGLLNDGKLLLETSLETLKKSTKTVLLTFAAPPPSEVFDSLGAHLLRLEQEEGSAFLCLRDVTPEVLQRIENIPDCRAEVRDPDLEEIFFQYTKDTKLQATHGKEAQK